MIGFSSMPPRALLALCIAASTGMAFGADPKLEEALAQGGLQKVAVKGVDLVYARPGAKLSTYDKVIVEPVQVSFAASWNPKRSGSSQPLTEQDRDAIRSRVAKLVQEEFVRELTTKSGYQVVTSPGPDVLRVRPDVMNLYVTAPEAGVGTRSRTYITSAGQMTLVAELLDSASGQVQARVVDRKEAQRFTGMKLGSSAENEAQARQIAAGWAKALRAAMDRAHGVGGK